MFQAFVCSLPLPSLCPSCLPAGWHFPMDFNLTLGCFKPHASGIPMAQTHSDSLGKILLSNGQKFIVNHNTQLVPGFAALWHLCSNISKRGGSPVSIRTFACGKTVWSLPNTVQARELPLPVWHMGPSDLSAAFWEFALLPCQSTARL